MQPEFIPPSPYPAQKRLNGKVMLIIAGVIIMIIVAAGLLIASMSKNPTASMDKLTTRMDSLTLYIAEGSKNAKLDTLRKINSDAGILISGDTTTIKSATSTAGAKGDNKEVVAAEKARQKQTLDTLKKAAIDGRFDKEYLATLEAVLTDTQTLLAQVNADAPQKAVKAATRNAHEHIAAILESLKAVDIY